MILDALCIYWYYIILNLNCDMYPYLKWRHHKPIDQISVMYDDDNMFIGHPFHQRSIDKSFQIKPNYEDHFVIWDGHSLMHLPNINDIYIQACLPFFLMKDMMMMHCHYIRIIIVKIIFSSSIIPFKGQNQLIMIMTMLKS